MSVLTAQVVGDTSDSWMLPACELPSYHVKTIVELKRMVGFENPLTDDVTGECKSRSVREKETWVNSDRGNVDPSELLPISPSFLYMCPHNYEMKFEQGLYMQEEQLGRSTLNLELKCLRGVLNSAKVESSRGIFHGGGRTA